MNTSAHSEDHTSHKSKSLLLSAKDIERILNRMAHEIIERKTFDKDSVAIIGVRTRGVFLAERLKQKIESIEPGLQIPIGTLDITFHRDDLQGRRILPEVGTTEINFSVENKTIILVDDVLYTGRTVRAALDELMDFGRPRRILLAVLIDRGHRELPVRADFVGKNIPSQEKDRIQVMLGEVDNTDEVWMHSAK